MTERVWESGDSYIERHVLPNGMEVFYKEPDHSYWREYKGRGSCSKRIAGISTVSKVDGETNKDGLLDWAAKLTMEGVAREAAMGFSVDPEDAQQAFSWLTSQESIESALRSTKLTWRDLRAEKGDTGTDAHNVLEALANGLSVLPTNGYERAVVRWWNDTNPQAELTEQVVASEKLNVAGRFDLFTADKTLRDLKVSKWVSAPYFIQLNLYRIVGIECGVFDEVDALTVIQVREDGSYREISVPINESWAIKAVEMYHAGRLLSSAVRKSWRTPWIEPDPQEVAA